MKHKDHSLALVILNIDDFKLYNQLYGNKEGDIALKRVAQIIRATVGNNGSIARYGGKEFAVILPMYDILAAKTLAENIRKQILNMNKRAKDYTLKVLTVSGGICAIPHSASTVKQLIDNADMAVYHAKRKGKNLILAYSVEKKELGRQVEFVAEESRANIYAEYAPDDLRSDCGHRCERPLYLQPFQTGGLLCDKTRLRLWNGRGLCEDHQGSRSAARYRERSESRNKY